MARSSVVLQAMRADAERVLALLRSTAKKGQIPNRPPPGGAGGMASKNHPMTALSALAGIERVACSATCAGGDPATVNSAKACSRRRISARSATC